MVLNLMFNTIFTPLDQFDIIKLFDGGSFVSFSAYYKSIAIFNNDLIAESDPFGVSYSLNLFLIDF